MPVIVSNQTMASTHNQKNQSIYSVIAYMLSNLCGNNVSEGRGRGVSVQVFDPPLDWTIWSLAENCQHPCQSDWA